MKARIILFVVFLFYAVVAIINPTFAVKSINNFLIDSWTKTGLKMERL